MPAKKSKPQAMICLVRGINVGSTRTVRMAELRVGHSKLATGIERALGVSVTARNWNTVEMGEALESA